jgi:hypothetical protein
MKLCRKRKSLGLVLRLRSLVALSPFSDVMEAWELSRLPGGCAAHRRRALHDRLLQRTKAGAIDSLVMPTRA